MVIPQTRPSNRLCILGRSTHRKEVRERFWKCHQQELRAEQNTAPRVHCSAVPGETEPCLPSVESQFKMSKERKTQEVKVSLCKIRHQEKERKENQAGENRAGLQKKKVVKRMGAAAMHRESRISESCG